MICRVLQRINIVSGFVKTFNTPVSFLWLIAAAWIVFYPGNALSADWVRISNHQNGDAAWHCHINRMHARKSVSASYQAAAVAVFQTSNASVRNPLNMDLLSK